MTVGTSAKLKQLQTRKGQLETEIPFAKAKAKEYNEQYTNKLKEMKKVDKDIQGLSEFEPVVSEHALLRYFERVLGVDLEEIKSRILTKDISLYIKNMGDGKYPIGEGFKVVVKRGCIVTVVEG